MIQRKKMQRLLIAALLLVMLITGGVLWWGFFSTSFVSTEGILSEPRRVDIDISILSHPVFQELKEPRAPTQVPLNVGRDNPFLLSP